MKRSLCLVVLFCFVSLFGGCGRGDTGKSGGKNQKPEYQAEVKRQPLEINSGTSATVAESAPQSSYEVVQHQLASLGIHQGWDVEKGIILAVATDGFSISGQE